MDRTEQFTQLANEAKRAQPPAGPLSLPKAQAPKLLTASRQMCRQMKATAQLTKELLQLAQQKGLFTDPAQQIAELAPTIRANIKAMESQLASFASAIGQYSLSRNARGHWNGVLEIMKAQGLANATGLRNALKARSEALADQATRRAKLSAGQWVSSAAMKSPLFAAPAAPRGPSSAGRPAAQQSVPSTAPAPAVPNFNMPAGALRRRPGHTSAETALPWKAGGSGPPSAAPAVAAFPTDRYSAQKIAHQRQARERLSTARAVESSIAELGEMMGRMASLVAADQATIDSIEGDALHAHDAMEAARAELYKYYAMVSEDRGLIVKSLAVVAAIIVLFMVFK